MRRASLRDQLAQLVAAKSVSSADPALDCSNRLVIDLLAQWSEDHGFMVELQTVGTDGKVNLIARRGAGEGGLVLAGHTDTVPCDPDRWQSDPYRLTERDGRWYGLGTADMKCFFPAVFAAVSTIAQGEQRCPITILATADEETSMAGARALEAAGRSLGHYCLIGEPTSLQPVHMHKGVAQLAIDLIGRSGHASNPALGINALDGMREVLNALHDWRGELARQDSNAAFDVPNPTLNFGAVKGGDNANRICGHCELLLDLRFVPGQDPPATVARLLAAVKGAVSGSGLTLETRELMAPIPAYATPVTGRLVRLVEELAGRPATTVTFATEAPFLSALGLETVILGPGAIEQAHQPDEYVDVAALSRMVDLTSALIYRVCCS